MIQLNDITLIFSDNTGYPYQFARLVRNENGYCEDSVTLDEAVLYNRGHGDHVHVSAT